MPDVGIRSPAGQCPAPPKGGKNYGLPRVLTHPRNDVVFY